MEKTYYTDNEVAYRYGVSRITIWRWVREGRFPSPVRIGPSTTRWKLSDLQVWETEQEGAA